MKIELPPDIEQVLTKLARKRGTRPEHIVVKSLRERFSESIADSSERDEESLAEFLAGHIGVLHSSEEVPGGARMSEDTGRKFAALMERKRRESGS